MNVKGLDSSSSDMRNTPATAVFPDASRVNCEPLRRSAGWCSSVIGYVGLGPKVRAGVEMPGQIVIRVTWRGLRGVRVFPFNRLYRFSEFPAGREGRAPLAR